MMMPITGVMGIHMSISIHKDTEAPGEVDGSPQASFHDYQTAIPTVSGAQTADLVSDGSSSPAGQSSLSGKSLLAFTSLKSL